jgi:arabinofuranan 3-O-arabinosyltransferase
MTAIGTRLRGAAVVPAGTRDEALVSVARRWMWFGLAATMLALPFLSEPGRYVNDTRDALWLAPNAYMSHVLQLWHANPFVGFEQHDGIAFPMGATIWLLRTLGIPAWAVERLWHGALLFGAAAFAILLIDRLLGRRTVVAPLVGGLTYALTPFAFGYGLPFTGTFLAYVLLPLLMLIVLIGVTRRGLIWPATFGLAAFLMGGGNGAPQAYALITCALLLGWLAFVDRAVPTRQALRFGGLAFAFFVGLNAYWLFLLGSSEIRNALLYSEVPKVINVDSSPAETVRGLGLWLFYGGDRYGSWAPTVRPYITSPLLIVTGFAIPIGALASAWRVRWRLRAFFVLLAILAVFVAGGVFPVESQTPFARILAWSYAHVPGTSGLRTTYKFVATVNLSLAVLVAMGVEPALAALHRLRMGKVVPAIALAAAFALLATNAYPLWTGSLYPRQRSMAGVPAYWQHALTDLSRIDGSGRAFFAPSSAHMYYRWGLLKEGVVSSRPNLPAIAPIRLPVADRYGSNLLAATEQPYFNGTGIPGTAVLLRYLGVTNLVLQNDVDWQRSTTARPAATHRLVRAPGLELGRSYGLPGQNTRTSSGATDPFERFEGNLPPVQLLHVSSPLPIVRAEQPQPVILSGDGFGISSAADAGLLDANPPILYSGALDAERLAQAIRSDARIVVSDSNRRRVWLFTVPKGRHSATLPSGQTFANKPTGYSLFGGKPDTQSVAIYPGLRAIEASTDRGSVLGSLPSARPALAFDGNPSTWWRAGGTTDPVGAWIQADLSRPRELSRLSITIPNATEVRPIEAVRIEFPDGRSVTSPVRAGGTTQIRFPPRRAGWFRVVVAAAAPSAAAAAQVGIADIGIPGMHPAEIIRVPNDLTDALRRSQDRALVEGLPITYLFDRQRTGPARVADEEAGIDRRFEVPVARSFDLTGTAHLNRTAPDATIDALLIGTQPMTVTSSSRHGGDPAFRGSAAFDGWPGTVWSPDGSVGQWVRASFPKTHVGSLTIRTDLATGHAPITGLRATLSDGTVIKGKLTSSTGIVTMRFRPRSITSITVAISSVFSPSGSPTLPVAIRDIHVSGVAPLPLPPRRPSCFDGLGSTIDGNPISLRVDGTTADLLAGKNLTIRTCHPSPLGLGDGYHDLRFGGAMQPDSVMLASPGTATTRDATGPTAPLPRITSTGSADGRLTIHVRDASAPFFLTIGQNYNARWRATVGGRTLGEPLVVDGYSAGWYIDRAGTYTVEVSYGPQRLYSRALAVTAASLLVALAAVVEARARRRARRRRA